jgi:hypothetical protein
MRWVTGVVLGFVLGCVLTSGGQQAAPPPSPAEQFLRTAGLKESLEKQREQNLAMTRQQITQLMDQLDSEGQLPNDVRAELSAMSADMVENIHNAYTVDEALAVYARAWDRNYPGDEFQKAMGELSTPDGQRLMRTVNESISETAQFIQQRRQTATQQETNRFVARFRELMKQARAPQQR